VERTPRNTQLLLRVILSSITWASMLALDVMQNKTVLVP
jgi:hypothetical protein